MIDRTCMCRFSLVGPWTALWFAILMSPTLGAVVASDSAADFQYFWQADGGWKGLHPTADENPPGMDNGGFGFLPWNFAGGYHQPQYSPYGRQNHFIDGSDFPASTYNDLDSPAFVLTNANFAFGGHTARATRPFASPLEVGDTFSLQFDNPMLMPLDGFAPAGFLIRLNSGGGPVISGSPTSGRERFGIAATSDFLSGRWFTSDLSGSKDTGLASSVTTSGAEFRFQLQTAESYVAEILRLDDGQVLFSQSGMLSAPATGAIDAIEILIYGNGSGNGMWGVGGLPTGEREFYFNNLRIERADSVLSGDYNRDGLVNAADYTVWRNALGQMVTPGMGADGNGDGTIDEFDYGVWKTNFGSTSGGTLAALVSVPEPKSVLLLLTILLCGRLHCSRFRP